MLLRAGTQVVVDLDGTRRATSIPLTNPNSKEAYAGPIGGPTLVRRVAPGSSPNEAVTIWRRTVDGDGHGKGSTTKAPRTADAGQTARPGRGRGRRGAR